MSLDKQQYFESLKPDVIMLYKNGYDKLEIADKLNTPIGIIRDLFKFYNISQTIQLSSKGTMASSEEINDAIISNMLDFLNKGVSLITIYTIINISKSEFKNIINTLFNNNSIPNKYKIKYLKEISSL